MKELYFDDTQWAIRYLGVDTRKWLPGRRVLLSPSSFTKIDPDNQTVHVSNDKETVRNSPSLEEASSMTPSYEVALTRYYGWTPYWTGGLLWGRQDVPLVGTVDEKLPDRPEDESADLADEITHNLREIDELKESFTVHASDGKIGKIDDVVIDDNNWKLRYLVVETGQDYRWKYVLLSPDWTQSVDWVDNNIYLDVTLEVVRTGPGIQEKGDISRQYEQELHTAYGKASYWNY
ncbi:PRC-barrel domain-containing protein [Sediminibacillus albus]|uniref:PRC-barrel domain-containing protein n=1 Tax=Sediminibacillus albus TaxID=407036 RepID=A0A1G9CBN4_9BACI|nr:PRC-barrel domain-containing protein [Sediminibacillus albus]SDK48854.1 PRC-barrel domain-containing protein [Sediminibacillus albus]